jgi:hypothetical protein
MIWDILGEAGFSVGVVGHWVTWPAAPVNGFLLSNYTWPPAIDFEKEWSPEADWDTVRLRTYPEGLDTLVSGAIQERRFVSEADFPNAEALDPALRHYLEKDLSYLNAAFALHDERRPRFFTFYMESTDFFPHRLWMFHRYYEATRLGGSMEGLPFPDPPPPSAVVERFGPMVSDTYRLADRVLGLLLERFDPRRDLVIVVSDHGFRTYPEEPLLHVGDERFLPMPFWHGERGILLGAGPPFGRGTIPGPVRPEDVAVLLLAALGLPIGADMDGEIPEGVLARSYMEEHPPARVETWERGAAGAGEPVPSAYDERILEMLKSLGYVE